VATSAWDGMLRLWSLPDGKLIETHRLQRSGIYALALSPDGRTLAAGGQDGVTRFWNIAARQETIRWIEQRIVTGIWFTPSNDAVVINTGMDVRVLRAPPVGGGVVASNDQP
jgi:WD40 repeat protein